MEIFRQERKMEQVTSRMMADPTASSLQEISEYGPVVRPWGVSASKDVQPSVNAIHFASNQSLPTPASTFSGTFSFIACSISSFTTAAIASASLAGASSTSSS